MVGKQIISDTYLFIVEENGGSEVTLDAVAYDLDTYAQGYSVQVNLDSAKEAVSNFIRRCVQIDKQDEYLKIINDTYRRVSDEFDYKASKVLEC